MERQIRELGAKIGPLEILTGTHAILELDGKPIFLDKEDGKIPVPRLFWKAIVVRGKNKWTDHGMAVIAYNNPYRTRLPSNFIQKRFKRLREEPDENWLSIAKETSAQQAFAKGDLLELSIEDLETFIRSEGGVFPIANAEAKAIKRLDNQPLASF